MKIFLTAIILFAGITRLNAQNTVGLLPAGLDEISGITLSSHKNVFAYVHNDSGDKSRFFAIDSNAQLITTISFKGSENNGNVRDCEDIAVGKGAKGEQHYVYVGDIGNNFGLRPFVCVYKIAETDIQTDKTAITVTAVPVFLRYPDGPRDAETLMIDNIDRLLYIVSKREDSVHVYVSRLDWNKNDTITLTKKAVLFFAGSRPQKWIVSGDISRDGSKVILKSLSKVYYWERAAGEPIWKTLSRPPLELPYQKEPQGEAICFDEKGTGYYTTSEGKNQPVYYYRIPVSNHEEARER